MSRDEDHVGSHGDDGPDDRSGAAWNVRRSGPSPWLLLAVVVAIVLVVFAALNFRPVRVNFVLFTTRARVVTVIVVAALLGFLVGWFVGRPGREERRHLREWRAGLRLHDERR